MCAIERATMESPGEEAGRSAAPAPHPPAANGSNKIIGRNVNGTMVVTSAPANEAELQLYRVMQRASLLAYYDTLLEMGGDDVQQLCDAGEEEFLEIMALVGMASKPLHVRRLQKALQEWVNNPALFQVPIVPSLCPAENPFIQCNQRLLGLPATIPSVVSPERARPAYTPSPGAPDASCGSSVSAPVTSPASAVPPASPAPAPLSAGSSPRTASPPPPLLLPAHVRRLAAAAAALSARLPRVEPRAHNHKKKACKELAAVMALAPGDARRMEQVRRFAAIYGRFDCKRKPEKPLTLHELLVNEAAAQLCGAVPALLTRRDELFPLARQLVRRAGLHYSKHGLPGGPGGPAGPGGLGGEDEDASPAKRTRQDRDDAVRSPDQPRSNSNHGWWGKTESEDGDSRCSHCSDNTPPPETESSAEGNVDVGVESGTGGAAIVASSGASSGAEGGVGRVVATRGDAIIAVTNPALHDTAQMPAR